MKNYGELINWFENLKLGDLDHIGDYYSDSSYFKDPFNELDNLEDIKKIYSHMFESLESPRFKIVEKIEGDSKLFITWDFLFFIKKKEYKIHGSTHFKFLEGKIIYHRDYWDTGEELLLKIPVVKSLYQLLREKFSIEN